MGKIDFLSLVVTGVLIICAILAYLQIRSLPVDVEFTQSAASWLILGFLVGLALIMAIGCGAKLVGYTKEELEQIADAEEKKI